MMRRTFASDSVHTHTRGPLSPSPPPGREMRQMKCTSSWSSSCSWPWSVAVDLLPLSRSLIVVGRESRASLHRNMSNMGHAHHHGKHGRHRSDMGGDGGMAVPQPLLWVLVPLLAVFAAGCLFFLLWTRRQRRRRRRRRRLGDEERQTARSWPDERGGGGGVAAARRNRSVAGRSGAWGGSRAGDEREEGLDERGEAPPPYEAKCPSPTVRPPDATTAAAAAAAATITTFFSSAYPSTSYSDRSAAVTAGSIMATSPSATRGNGDPLQP
ncbi:hypothetical protein CP532_5762 [Ophiocordyceps camponoti-leonardi (nom. inval.)]|nr:hypothetical protein CP532_5762 [Ophiocordyceps camponoti-leonardi (nom. inval.)]